MRLKKNKLGVISEWVRYLETKFHLNLDLEQTLFRWTKPACAIIITLFHIILHANQTFYILIAQKNHDWNQISHLTFPENLVLRTFQLQIISNARNFSSQEFSGWTSFPKQMHLHEWARIGLCGRPFLFLEYFYNIFTILLEYFIDIVKYFYDVFRIFLDNST